MIDRRRGFCVEKKIKKIVNSAGRLIKFTVKTANYLIKKNNCRSTYNRVKSQRPGVILFLMVVFDNSERNFRSIA